MWSTVMCVAWFENWICLKSFWVGKSLDGILLYTTSFNHRWPMVNGQPNGAERVLFYAIKLWHTSCQPQPPAKASEKKLSWCVFAGSGSLLRCKFCEGFSQDPKLPSLISIPQQDSCVFGVQVILLATTSAPPPAVVFLLWLWGAKVRTRRERSTMCVPSIICLPRSWVTWFNKPMSHLSSTEWLPVVWWIVSRERIRTVGMFKNILKSS